MKKTGVWIDTKKAVIVSLTENNQEVKTIHYYIEARERIPGETKAFTRFGIRVFDFGNKKKKRLATEKLEFVKKVGNEVMDAGEIVLFGPAEMKNELGKFMRDDRAFESINRTIETADSMSENQIVAWIKKR